MTVVLSHHAAQRCKEFGVGLDVVETIATRPDVAWTDASGERVCTSDAHPDWTVVVGDGDLVVTVLRRTGDRWEHTNPSTTPHASPARPVADAARPPVRPSAQAAVGRTAPTREPAARVGAVPARPVTVRRVDPDTLASAVELADGDFRRLVFHDDGSVTVLNRPRGTRQSPERIAR